MTTSPNTAEAAKPLSKRVRPPFRADHVGSLLRPKHLLEAREKLDKGEITAAELRHIEDEAIRHAVRRQEEVGLKLITYGEFRRRSWHMDFICRIGGVISRSHGRTPCIFPCYQGKPLLRHGRNAGAAVSRVAGGDRAEAARLPWAPRSRSLRRPSRCPSSPMIFRSTTRCSQRLPIPPWTDLAAPIS